MSATQIKDALPGEQLLALEPALLQQVNAGWLQRLSMFTGRVLSDTALSSEQLYRAGRLTMLGQAVTPGTVQGLDLSVDTTAADPTLMVTPGYGISATGQDVSLSRPINTKLSGIAVLNGTTGAYIADFGKYTAPAGQPWVGVLLLQPIVAAVAGSAVDTGSTNIIVSGNLDASCDQDPAEYAFGDQQLVDGARLVLLTWPSAPALPAALPAATWRNRLAWTIFNAEQALAPDDALPWTLPGVPLALASFDATSKLQFVDRSAVVRTGGLRRRRYVVPGGNAAGLVVVEPALANARVNQLAEQLGQMLAPSSVVDTIANQFAFLPPCGVLPSWTMNYSIKAALWCPAGWTVKVRPVFVEELEGVLRTGMTAAPLDLTVNEAIEVLVPIPDAVYDPNILITEVIDPVFSREVDAARLARNVILQHRKIVQQEANALAPLLGQSLIDIDAGLTPDEISGRDGASVFTADPDEAFGTVLTGGAYASTELQNLQAIAAAPPYTVTSGSTQLGLFTADWPDIAANGLEHFINRVNAKLKAANDNLDLGFLTAQTDIYRYRQNVLGSTDATRLAVSPILANIATADTAAETAQNIQSYLTSIGIVPGAKPPATPSPIPVTTQPAASTGIISTGATTAQGSATVPPAAAPAKAITAQLNLSTISNPIAKISSPVFTSASAAQLSKGTLGGAVFKQPAVQQVGVFTPISVGTVAQPATPADVTQALPIVGAIYVRTLTVADRLSPPAAQEALLYSVANRVATTNLLGGLNLTIDDLPVAVDGSPAGAPFTLADLRPSPATQNSRANQLFAALYNPQLSPPLNSPIGTVAADPDAASYFSAGIHVLEQHTQLMRAVEGRVQQYQDFLSLCSSALGRIQYDMRTAQALLTRLGNDLAQARQNLAFVSALLADETARINSVNAARVNILQTQVPFIAYARPRTLLDIARTPSRQLQPANVASPVPACLRQSVAIPPELREMVSLLREAPVYWFPAMMSQVAKLERPAVLQGVASSIQMRAAAQTQTSPQVSSAASAPGIYSASIASAYSSGLATVRTYQTLRASFDPTQLATQSWSAQVNTVQSVAAVSDLMYSSSIYTEISSAASRALQQISSVATCLYTRVGNALPALRLEWAEFLENAGLGVNLRSLAALPEWNSQTYTDRQQMQLLVDWLFQQIDSSDATATALMSDLVAVAILLASNAPVDNIISGAVALRGNATVGGTVRLTLPSDRVAHGMNVQLYSAGTLAARAVVSDLDNSGVTATITDVYQEATVFQPNDIAHYTALDSNALVYKAFSTP